MRKGRIIILSGPSGSGKTTLHDKLLRRKSLKGKLVKSVSATTRASRPGEKHGREYFFLSVPMFRFKQKAGHFLESMKVFQHQYGTPAKNVRDLLKKGKNVLLCIDVQGAKEVCRKHPDSLKIFVRAPSQTVLKQRLKTRGTEDPQALKVRLEIAKRELKEAGGYDYVFVNDNLAATVSAIEKTLKKELDL